MKKDLFKSLKNKKAAVLVAMAASFMVSGCALEKPAGIWGMNFSVENNFTCPDDSELISVDSMIDSLTKIDKCQAVEEVKQADETLMDPMFSLSTAAFPVVQVLEENDYFKYDLLKEADYKALDKITEPTNVSVTVYSDNTYTKWSCQFSCFIYKIDPDYIYLGTAGHCIVPNSDRTRAVITFFDRTEVKASLADYQMGSKFGSTTGDYAMYRMETSKVPTSLLMKLKEVSYNEKAITNVKSGDVLYSGNIYARNKKVDYDKKMTVLNKAADPTFYTGRIAYINSNAYFATNTPLVPGQSGSAVFDKYGNLVAICSGYAYASNHPAVGIYSLADKMDDMYDAFQKQDLKRK